MERTNRLLKKKAIKFCNYVANALINHPDNAREGIPFCVTTDYDPVSLAPIVIIPLRDIKAHVSIGSLWGDDGDEILALMMQSKTLKNDYGLDINSTSFHDDYLAILNRAKFTAIRYTGK